MIQGENTRDWSFETKEFNENYVQVVRFFNQFPLGKWLSINLAKEYQGYANLNIEATRMILPLHKLIFHVYF